jgi:hypothetical protein
MVSRYINVKSCPAIEIMQYRFIKIQVDQEKISRIKLGVKFSMQEPHQFLIQLGLNIDPVEILHIFSFAQRII